MSNDQIIRAWKDASFRNSLSADELAEVPTNPAGIVDISDQDLEEAVGATSWPCGLFTSVAYSCAPACGSSMWDGTCNIASIGCCL